MHVASGAKYVKRTPEAQGSKLKAQESKQERKPENKPFVMPESIFHSNLSLAEEVGVTRNQEPHNIRMVVYYCIIQGSASELIFQMQTRLRLNERMDNTEMPDFSCQMKWTVSEELVV